MIVTTQEAKLMMGWSAILAIRILEIFEQVTFGSVVTPDLVMRSPLTEGLFDFSKGISPATRESVELVLQAVADARPNTIKKVEGKGNEYVSCP